MFKNLSMARRILMPSEVSKQQSNTERFINKSDKPDEEGNVKANFL